MNKHLTLIGSVIVLSAFGLTACDSVTATNEEKVAEAAKPVMEQVVAKAVEAPKAAAQVLVAATPKIVAAAATDAAEIALVSAVVEAVAVKKPDFKEGEHYFEIYPAMQTDAVSGKVEVVELLWLGCPHCFALEPTIKEYTKDLPDYIDFKQVPAMLNPRWSADARTFYIAEILDPKGDMKLVDKVFHAIHVQKRARMSAPDVVKRFMLQQGITEDQYENAANSMVLQAKLSRAKQVSADSQAQSVPTLIINGRYRTSPYAAGNEEKMIEIVNMLTKKEFDKK